MNRKILLIIFILIPILIFGYPQQNEISDKVTKFESARADSAHGFDVTKYELFLDVDTANHYIEGTVIAHVTATEVITQIAYEIESLSVSEALVNGEGVDFEVTSDL